MRDEGTSPFGSVSRKQGVYVVDGYGVKVYVQRRHLVVADGIGRQRRERRFGRATARIKRLMILGHEGYVTLEALRWMNDLGIIFIQVDRDGKVIAASASTGLNDARLRRAQALAAGTLKGFEISRSILRAKLQGQLGVLQGIEASDAAEAVMVALGELETAEAMEAVLRSEREAAAAYWKAWAQIHVEFPRSDIGKVPMHWLTFGQRASLLSASGSGRLATNPPNAMLNYLYAVLEAEARLACLAMGLDPAMGFFHTDQRFRDSLALDVIEAVRPEVDAYVLDLLSFQVFRARDFHETRQGVCRILPPLTHVLAKTSIAWGTRIGPVVEKVAKMLADGRIAKVPTRLTRDNYSAAREGRRRGNRSAPRASRAVKPPSACRSCGVILDSERRRYCEDCIDDRRAEVVEHNRSSASEALAEARAEGRDPAHGGEVAWRRGQAISRRNRERAAWDSQHGRRYREATFRAEILPSLADVPVNLMVEATGLTEAYCRLIRSGRRVPHARHWDALRRLHGLREGT